MDSVLPADPAAPSRATVTVAQVRVGGLPVGFALTAAIWHNDHTSQPVMRSLIACDHY